MLVTSRAVYKGFRLAVEKTEVGWRPHVITGTGDPVSEIRSGDEPYSLIDAHPVPYSSWPTEEGEAEHQ